MSKVVEANSNFERRHDLDAIRATAMLLGIVLHAAISFIPGTLGMWAVQDVRPHVGFGVLLAGIHGFRMQLFFLVSGFFSAMLWKKRGLKALVLNRYRRIFLPMIFSLMTIIPLTWYVSFAVRRPVQSTQQLTSKIATSEQSDPRRDELMAAVAFNQADEVAALLASGADINSVDERGTTPLHAAAFFGRAETAAVLIEAGADVTAVNVDGSTPAALLNSSWWITKLIADQVSVQVELTEVMQGREKIAAMLKVPFSAQEMQSASEWGFLAVLFSLLAYFPLLGHLWFLWFLCWLVLGFVVFVKAWKWWRLPTIGRAWVISGKRWLWLLPLTVIPQYFMNSNDEVNFGPATSLGILPLPAVFAYYAIFFYFGVLYFQTDDREEELGRYWPLELPVALFVLFPIGLATDNRPELFLKVVSLVCQVAYAWLVSTSLIGLFRAWFSGQNNLNKNSLVRYVSDSSYWLYLAHIPLIIYLQYIVSQWEMPSVVKFAIVCAAATAILLITYQLFVRHTMIGRLLNGSKKSDSASSISHPMPLPASADGR